MTTIQPYAPEPAPITLQVDGPAPQRRWSVLLRWLLAVPQFVVLYLLRIAAEVIAVIGWFGALFTGRLPDFAREFLCGYLDWSARVYGYLMLLTDRYPPFALGPADYPVRLGVPPSQPLNRLAVFFRMIIAIPAGIVVDLVVLGASTLAALVTWLIVLVTGRMPPALHGAYGAVLRFWVRYTGWFLMLTPAYPAGLFGDEGGAYPWLAPVPAPAPAEAPVVGPVPDVFTYGGTTHVWGYTADRQVCGVWRRDEPALPAEWWPIERQDDGWARFRALEPGAVEYRGPGPAELGFTRPSPPAGPLPTSTAAGTGAPSGSAAVGFPPPGAGTPPAFGVPPGVGAPPGAARPAPAWPSTATTGDASRGLMVLEQASRRLIGAFLALGAVAWVGFVVALLALAATSGGVSHVADSAVSSILQQEYRTLHSATSQYESQTESCASAPAPLACVTSADASVADAFADFSIQVSDLPVLGSAAERDQAQLIQVANQAHGIFTVLSKSTSAQDYQQLLAGSGLQKALDTFDADYDRLQQALGGS